MENSMGKHYGLEIASSVLNVIAILMFGLVFVLAANTNFYDDVDLVLLELFVLITLIITFVGTGIGVVGLCMKNIKKNFAVVGTVISNAVKIILFIVMVIGNM